MARHLNRGQPKQQNNRETAPAAPITAPEVPTTVGQSTGESWKFCQTKLRDWLADEKKAIVFPSVYDGLTARIALAQRFECLQQSKAAIGLARTGVVGSVESSQDLVPDLARIIRRIDENVPLIGEVDKSLNAEAVKAAVARFHHAEFAAVQFDDDPCDRCSQKNLALTRACEDTFLHRIQAAAKERSRYGSDIVIIARTNVLLSCRCKKCISRSMILLRDAVEAGANVVSLPSSFNFSEIEMMTRETFEGVAVMLAPYGISTKETQSLGAKMIPYPELFTAALFQGVSPLLRAFQAKGDIVNANVVPDPERPEMMGGLFGLTLDEGESNRDDCFGRF